MSGLRAGLRLGRGLFRQTRSASHDSGPSSSSWQVSPTEEVGSSQSNLLRTLSSSRAPVRLIFPIAHNQHFSTTSVIYATTPDSSTSPRETASPSEPSISSADTLDPTSAASETDAETNVSSNNAAASAIGVASSKPQLSITEQILQARIQPANEPASSSSSDGNSSSSSSSSSSSDESSSSDSSQSDSAKKTWFQRNGWKLGVGYVSFMGLLGGGVLVKEWGAPKRDEEGNEVKDEFSELDCHWLEQYFRRCYHEVILFKEMIQEPVRPRLLPDPLTEPYFQPPYTLVLEMTGVLVHPDWTYRTGWRFKKRPQVEHFLQQVTTPLFEIVVFTSEHAMTAYAIIDNLDPNGYVMYRLFRDSTKYKDGVHYKDISHLNRDPKRVIVIDWDDKATSLQPENTLKGVERWTGDDDDRTLMDLAAFLRALAYSGVDDVRTVLKHYNQHDNPLQAFKDNQRRLAQEQETQLKMQQEMQEKKTLAGGAFRDLWGRRR